MCESERLCFPTFRSFRPLLTLPVSLLFQTSRTTCPVPCAHTLPANVVWGRRIPSLTTIATTFLGMAATVAWPTVTLIPRQASCAHRDVQQSTEAQRPCTMTTTTMHQVRLWCFFCCFFLLFSFFFSFFFFAQPPLFFPLQARPRKPGSNQPSAAGLRGRRNSARSSTSSSGLPSSSSSSSASSASSSSPSVASSAVPPGRRRSRLLHRTTMLTATLFSLFRQCQLAAASKAHAWCPPPPFPLQLGRRRLLPLTLPCSRHPLRAHPFASTDSVRLSARWFDAAAGWLSATTMAAPGRWWQRRQCVLVPPTMPLLLLLLLRPVTSHGEHGFGA